MELLSWNVGGLNDNKKRLILWNYIRQYNKDHSQNNVVWILQETHTTEETTKQWSFEIGPQYKIYASNGQSNSKGVWIIINNNWKSKRFREKR